MNEVAESPLELVLEASGSGESVLEKVERAASSERINALEEWMAKYPQVEIPPVHRFTPGMYIREIRMPAGFLGTSKIHKTEHPFCISQGRLSIWTEGNGWETVEAPYLGITKPGTRRVLWARTETVLTTFHPTGKTTPEEVEADIIHKHDFPIPIDVIAWAVEEAQLEG